jgi:hypothetical protein
MWMRSSLSSLDIAAHGPLSAAEAEGQRHEASLHVRGYFQPREEEIGPSLLGPDGPDGLDPFLLPPSPFLE